MRDELPRLSADSASAAAQTLVASSLFIFFLTLSNFSLSLPHSLVTLGCNGGSVSLLIIKRFRSTGLEPRSARCRRP